MATLTTPTIPAIAPEANKPLATSAIRAAMANLPSLDGCWQPQCGLWETHRRVAAARACRLGAGESLQLIPLLAAARVCTTRAGPRENPQFRARSGVPGGAAEAWAGPGGGRGGRCSAAAGASPRRRRRLAHPGLVAGWRWRRRAGPAYCWCGALCGALG